MDSIETIEDFIGEELTEDWARLLAEAPFDQIVALLNALSPAYYDWLETEIATLEGESNAESKNKQTYHCVDPYLRYSPWEQWLIRFKPMLLYYPSITIPDPLADMLWPLFMSAEVVRMINAHGYRAPPIDSINVAKLRLELKEALEILVKLRPFVKDQSFVLLPHLFVHDNGIMQVRTLDEMRLLVGTQKEHDYEKLIAKYEQEFETNKVKTEFAVGGVKLWGQVCAELDFTPIAASGLIRDILQMEYGLINLPRAASAENRVSQALMQFEVPGLSEVELSDVLSLRKNEDAFREWRIAYGQVLDMVQKESPKDQKAFDAEIRLAAETIMTPLTEQLKSKAKSSSALEKIFVPSALSIGGGLIAFASFGDSFPTAALVGAGLSPAGWVMEKLIRRFNKGGCKATMVREFYSYLLERK